MLTTFFAAWICIFIFASWGWKIGILSVAISIAIVMLPIEGFHKTELVKTERLIKLKRFTIGENNWYIEKRGKKVFYAFDNRAEYELEGTAYEEKCVRGKIKIYESSDCTWPVLKVYKTEPKTEFYTFAPFSTKTEYIFNVPEGTLLENKTTKYDSSINVV